MAKSNLDTPIDKTPEELGKLFKLKPEIDNNIDYFKGILRAYDSLSKNLKLKIKELSKSKELDNKIQVDKLTIELHELSFNLYNKKKRFEFWMEHRNEYEVYFEKVSKEANANFDSQSIPVRIYRLMPSLKRMIESAFASCPS